MSTAPRLRFIKIGVAAHASFQPASWADYKPGQFSLTHESLPVDFELVGQPLAPIYPGYPLQVFRQIRNGVAAPGLFCSSAVTELVAITQNSIYRVTLFDSLHRK